MFYYDSGLPSKNIKHFVVQATLKHQQRRQRMGRSFFKVAQCSVPTFHKYNVRTLERQYPHGNV